MAPEIRVSGTIRERSTKEVRRTGSPGYDVVVEIDLVDPGAKPAPVVDLTSKRRPPKP